MLEKPAEVVISGEEVRYRLGVLGLYANDIKLLCLLWKYPGIAVSQISELSGIGRTQCYMYVKRLEERGFLFTKIMRKKGIRPMVCCYARSAKEVIQELVENYNISFQKTLALADDIENYAKGLEYKVHSVDLTIAPQTPMLCGVCKQEFSTRKQVLKHKSERHAI